MNRINDQIEAHQIEALRTIIKNRADTQASYGIKIYRGTKGFKLTTKGEELVLNMLCGAIATIQAQNPNMPRETELDRCNPNLRLHDMLQHITCFGAISGFSSWLQTGSF